MIFIFLNTFNLCLYLKKMKNNLFEHITKLIINRIILDKEFCWC